MSTKLKSFQFIHSVKAQPSQVYRAFTNSTALREWLCDFSTVNPKPGGRFYAYWNTGFYACGEYKFLDTEKRIEMTWRGRNYPSNTNIIISIVGSQDTSKITLEHNDIGIGNEWAGIVDDINKGWKLGFENLISVLETGRDLRLIRQPMLGILVGEFSKDIAKELEVPVVNGVRLDEVLDDMGAKHADLKKDDVIITLNGKSIQDFDSLNATLQSLQAGDMAEIVYYRGIEKRKAFVTLSKRSIPEIPNTARELAQAVRRKYDEVNDELNKLLGEVTEEMGCYHPELSEWNVKEILAHLIHDEQGNINWISHLLVDQEPHFDDFGGNHPSPIQATISVYPTLNLLRDELSRKQAEKISLLEYLPSDFIERKGSFWRMAYYLLEASYHYQIHIEQMHNAITAAKK